MINKIGLSIIALVFYAASVFAGSVVINEVAWMGTTGSAYDEWIELYNTTASDIPLTGWTLQATDGTPSVNLSGTIPAYSFFLLERTDDTSVPGISADQIYAGSMENTGEALELRDGSSVLIDSVPSWFAGDNTLKSSMERLDPLTAGTESSNWGNANTSYGVGYGTPKNLNSILNDGTGTDSNCDYPDKLTISSINIGQGDATLIASKTKILLADAGETNWNSHNDASKVIDTLHDLYGANCNTIDYVVISHFHLDHIGYLTGDEDPSGDLLNEDSNPLVLGDNLLNPIFYSGYAYLVNNGGISVGTTFIRDYITHNPNKDPADGGSKTFRNWRAYLQSPAGIAAYNPTIAVLGTSQIDMGTINGIPIVVDIIQVDGATTSNPTGCDPATYFGGSQYLLRGDRTSDPIPPSENDLSIAFIVSFGNFQAFIGGDTSGQNYDSSWDYRYHDTESCIAADTAIQSAYGGHLEVLRANHHGSSHSSNQAFFDAFAPKITIFSVGDNNTYDHVDSAVLDRALAESIGDNSGEVFLTESGVGVFSAADACHSVNTSWCAQVADDEYPTSTESNEAGDAGVEIVVSSDGSSYDVQGNPTIPISTYSSN